MISLLFLFVFSTNPSAPTKNKWLEPILIPFKLAGGGIRNTQNFIGKAVTLPARAVNGVRDTVGSLKTTADAVKDLVSKLDREVDKTAINLQSTTSNIMKNLSKYRFSAGIAASSVAALSLGSLYFKFRRAKHENSLRK